jgi:predicted PurR-regulated permease PerM
MDTKKLQMSFFIGLLLAILVLAGAIFLPFLAPIALAIMAAVVVRPLHLKIVHVLGGRNTLASIAMVLLFLVIVLAPASFLVQRLTAESYDLYSQVSEGGVGRFDDAIRAALAPVQSVFPSFNPDIAGAVEYVSSAFVKNLGAIFSGTASIILGIFLFIVSFFYVLRDGHKFKRALVELSPLADAYDAQIIERLVRAVNSVIRGSFIISLVQGLLVGLGFLIFGIPNFVLWGTIAAVGSLLPTLGTGIVMVPAVLYLFFTGSVGAAVGLAIWGFVIVGFVDNMLLPVLVGKGFTVHPVFILFSIIGGVIFFGPVGLFLGPLIIALLFALLEIYKLIILEDKGKKVTSI